MSSGKLTGKRPKAALCGLQSLAREIVQYIAELLPTSSAAALALTNKSFLFILGRQYFNKVRGEYCDEGELRKFLLLIEKDVPGYYGCLDCLRLHAFDYAVPRRRRMLQLITTPMQRELPCKGIDTEAEAALFNTKPIKFFDLHNLMRHYRAGTLDPAALRRLSLSKAKEPEHASIHRSFQFQIIEDELYMRGYYSFIADLGGPIKGVALNRLYICPHFMYKGYMGSNKLKTMLECISMHLNTLRFCAKCTTKREKQECISSGLRAMASSLSWVQCTSLQSCDSCSAEFQIRIEQREDVSTVKVVVTRWLNLGDLESPYSPKYRSLMHHRSCRWENGKVVPLLSRQPGTIKEAFGD